MEPLNHMSKRNFGSLADLAKIMEAAADPNSTVREDRPNPKTTAKKVSSPRQVKAVDPKRKAWYERRLREQAEKITVAQDARNEVALAPAPQVTRGAVSKVGGTLLQVLAEAKSPKQGQELGKKRPEAWRRKPGDPIF